MQGAWGAVGGAMCVGELGECLIMVSNTATCLGITFLYWGMCKVNPHFVCSSVADVYRYITA